MSEHWGTAHSCHNPKINSLDIIKQIYIYTTHRIGQQMELIDRIAKVSGQNDANRNAMRDEHIIARIVGIE